MKWRTMAVLIAAAWSVAGPVRAATYLDRPYGTPQLGLSARSRAMGGTGAALDNGAYSLIDNPAALLFGRGNALQVSGAVLRASENRFVPLYDTFDSFVDESAIAVNNHGYGAFDLGGVFGFRDARLAVGWFDRFDPRYDYQDERRTTATTDEIVAERFIETHGSLHTLSVGGAIPLPAKTAAGAAIHAYFGTITNRDALVPRQNGVTGKVTTDERRLQGMSVGWGGTYEPDERIRAGLSFESGAWLAEDYSAALNDSLLTPAGAAGHVHLPWRLQGGLAYRPRNALRTTFALDVIYMPWSHLTDDAAATSAASATGQPLDTWDIRFGLEHVYYNTLPGRIGFRYARSYAMREADVGTITFGIGYRVAPFTLDLAGEVGKRISRQEPIWPRPEQGPAVGAGTDKVEDTVGRITFGARFER